MLFSRGKERLALIGAYRCEQRQIERKGKFYHFVSYDGERANVARGQLASSAKWYLMSAGTRWEAVPQLIGEELVDTDRRLLAWLEQTLTDPANAPAPKRLSRKPAMSMGLKESK